MASLPTLKSRKLMQAETENVSGEHDFSVVTYNILADFYLQSALSKGRYKNCPSEFVTPKQDRHCPRHKLLITEVRNRVLRGIQCRLPIPSLHSTSLPPPFHKHSVRLS